MMKILIVDDDLISIILFEKMLQDLDVEFIRAMSGEEALEKIKEEDISLALIDVHMPGMDGYQTVHKIRQIPGYKSLPVIFFSAIYSENYYAIKGLETGAVDFLTKPVIPQILKQKVKIFLELEREKKERLSLIQKLEKANKELKKEIEFRKMAENQLLEAKNKAEQSEKLKTAFLANMSHEIRTPMNAIIGFVDLLLENDNPPEQQKKYLQIIKSNSMNLLTLINDIIDLAKIESDQMEIERKPVKINLLLNELHIFFKNELVRRNKNQIELKSKFAFNNPQFTISTDPIRLKQIMNNLLDNAIKYTNRGFIEFGYKLSDDKKYIRFYVKDTGCGIPEDKFKLIFERFVQIGQRKDSINGTGLGLSISKKLVELLGGKIHVESEVNKGSIFYFDLPYQEHPINTLEEKVEKESMKKPDFSGKKVLIVEDVESNYLLLEAALKRTKAKIEHASSGEDAVQKVKENDDFDIVLMDIRLIGMDGIEATRQIKKIRPELPVIAQTAYAFAHDNKKITEAGVDDLLVKPIKAKQFYAVLSRYLLKD